MNIKQIITESDYKEALKRLGNIFDASPGTPEFNELVSLCVLIEKYEAHHMPAYEPGVAVAN